MELTIDQAFQQAVTAHNQGNIEKAERLYRTILQVQPTHPDANHNLGLIAVSVNNAEEALSLFKKSLEMNPKKEQFWLSYIDILIRENQFENAKKAVDQAKKEVANTEKFYVLGNQLLSEKKNASPSQLQLKNLLERYQNRQYEEAEKLALFITQEFPEHQFGWKVLGAIFGHIGRKFEAVKANQKAVSLSPQDTEAHSNLGNSLQLLGKLKEAEASYKQAIELQPDFATAHNNLGNTLQKLGRLKEAEASLRKAIAFKTDFALAHFNLGITLKELGKLDEAEASYRHAIALKADYAEAYNSLGNVLKELGKLDEAEASYRHAIALKANYTEAHYNLGMSLFDSKQYDTAQKEFELIDILQSKSYAIRCSYLQDKESIFYEKLDSLINQGEINAVIGSLTCSSEIKYGIKRLNPFCNHPLEYVLKINLNEQCDFEKIFVKTARDLLSDNSISRKAQRLLTNGVQTAGNIFSVKKISDSEIESIIYAEIEKYRVYFNGSEEGFIKNWPTFYKIKGWLVSMQSGGKLGAHMHELGWISGSIYINVPKKTEVNSGNLVLRAGDQENPLGDKSNQESIIEVHNGSLCLFPSSLHHYTIPFEDKENRIVLAFDVVPTK